MSFLAPLAAKYGLRALGWLAAAGAVLAVLLGARQAGRNAERVDALTRNVEVKDAQLEKAAGYRASGGAAGRLRDGTF